MYQHQTNSTHPFIFYHSFSYAPGQSGAGVLILGIHVVCLLSKRCYGGLNLTVFNWVPLGAYVKIIHMW